MTAVVRFGRVGILVALCLVAFGPGCGGGGGGGDSGTPSQGYFPDVRASDFRRGTFAFEENPDVAPLLDPGRGGLWISPSTNPPDIEGEYEYTGVIDYSEITPGDRGRAISGTLIFRNQGGGLVDITEVSPTLGAFTATGWFINGSGNQFTICYAIEASIDLRGYACTETDVGIINGTQLSNGDLDLEIGFVAVGIRGECLELMQASGIKPDDVLGKPVVTRATARGSYTAPAPAERSVTLYSTADTYTRSDHPTSNYGTEKGVGTGESSGATTYEMSGFVMFNLGSIPQGASIVRATLTIPIGYNNTYDSPCGTTSIYRVTGGSWSEHTLTHLNMPYQYSYVTSKSVCYERASNPTFDVTSAVSAWIESGAPNRGFRIASRNIEGLGSSAYFYSREQYSAGTVLEVTYR